jgi:hypothetical protein
MAHFALIDDTNIVQEIMFIDNANMIDVNGYESETTGSKYCASIKPGNWVQCSYNGNFRGLYPSIGSLYLEDEDIFLPPPSKPWNTRLPDGSEFKPEGINQRNGLPLTSGEAKAMEFFAKAGNPSWAETVLVVVAAPESEVGDEWSWV